MSYLDALVVWLPILYAHVAEAQPESTITDW